MSREAEGIGRDTLGKKYDVCAAVVGHLPFDARVWKEVRTLASAGYSVRLIGNRYDIECELRYSQHGVDVVEFPFGPRSGEASNLKRATSVLRLWREVLSTNARAFHAHNVHTFPSMFAASRLRRAKLVYDGHELYGEPSSRSISSRAKARVLRLVERMAIRRSDRVITTNISRVEILLRRHGRREIVCLRNVPYRVDSIAPIDPGYPQNVPILLYQGGIYAEARAFRETIASLPLLPELHLVILGFGRDGDLELIDTWAREFGVSERVHRLGPRPFDQLVHTAAMATIGLVPLKPVSLNSWLGDTNKLHEYLMAGVPVVASSFPEVRRVVEQGDPAVGETFDPENPRSIADAIGRILDDPRYGERRAEARRLAVEQHNWESESHRLVGLYEDLIGPPKVQYQRGS